MSRKRIYKTGDTITLLLRQDTSDEVINWLNYQVKTGPTILEILEKYVSRQLVDVKYLTESVKK